MAQTVYFNGEILTIPGAYSTIDTSAMATKGNAADAKVIALLGECDGGEPELFSSSLSRQQPDVH